MCVCVCRSTLSTFIQTTTNWTFRRQWRQHYRKGPLASVEVEAGVWSMPLAAIAAAAASPVQWEYLPMATCCRNRPPAPALAMWPRSSTCCCSCICRTRAGTQVPNCCSALVIWKIMLCCPVPHTCSEYRVIPIGRRVLRVVVNLVALQFVGYWPIDWHWTRKDDSYCVTMEKLCCPSSISPMRSCWNTCRAPMDCIWVWMLQCERS